MQRCREDAIGRMVYMTTMAFRKYLDERLKPFGLTTEQFQVLKVLAEGGSGIPQSQIAEGVGKSPANITRLLDRLEAKQWLERRNNPEDRRSSLIFLTDEGNRLIEKVMEELLGLEEQVTAGISMEEMVTIRRGLLRMQKNIEEYLQGERRQ